MADTTEFNPDLPHTGEDRAHAIPIPVVSANEAVRRQVEGDRSPVMVDTQAGGAPPASQEPRRGWAVSEDEANTITGQTPAPAPAGPSPVPQAPRLSPWNDPEVVLAGLRQSNALGAAYERYIAHPDATAPDVPGYSAYNNNGIAGYEDHRNAFDESNSPQQTQVIKDRIDAERRDQQTINRAGAAGLVSTLGASVVDPFSLVLMVPGVGELFGASRLARVGSLVASNVAAGEAQQAAITSMQTTTHYADGLIPRIGANALLAGTLGTWATRVPKAEFTAAAKTADIAINGAPKEPTTEFFHSSPHVFDQFDAAKLGTGEGNQSFGIGKAYVATNENVAKYYNNIAESKGLPAQMYRGEMKTSDVAKMLDMDKPLTEQPGVLKALGVDPAAPVKLNGVDPKWTGSELYDNMRQGRTNLGVTDKAGFSSLLESKGVTGIKYLDAQSRAAGDGSGNMVIFGNTEANLTHRNGQPINQAVPTESTGGAAAVRGTTLEDESFAKGGQAVAAADNKLLPHWLSAPNLRVMSASPFVESRRLMQRIVSIGGGTLNKNMKGVATPTSVEMVANQISHTRDLKTARAIDDLFADYTKDPANAGPNQLNKYQFGAEALKALSNGDKHEIPQVSQLAKVVRPFLDDDHAMLQKIAPDADYSMLHKTAESYAPRVWDNDKITADRSNFERFLQDHFKNNPKTVEVPEAKVKMEPKAATGNKKVDSEAVQALGERIKENNAARREIQAVLKAEPDHPQMKAALEAREVERAKLKAELADHTKSEEMQPGVGPPKPIFRDPAEIKAAVQDTLDNIQHAVRGTADVGTGVRNPKSAQDRKLDVTDNAARPWLSSDFESTMKAYNRSMVPHIEMHRQFGSVTLESEIQQISDAARVQMERAGNDDAAKAKIVKARESDINDIALARDRVLGQAGVRNDATSSIVKGASLIRQVNYVRSLGGQLFSALPDQGRLVGHYGLANTAKTNAQFLASSEFRNIAIKDAQEMGTATDVALHTREHSIEGTGDNGVAAGGRFGAFAQKGTALFTKMSGIAHWDSYMRVMSTVMEQNAIKRLIDGESMSAFERSKLAAHGIGDEDLAAIKSQWAKYGSDEGGMSRARTSLWDDKDAAQKVEQAVQNAASNNAFFVGKGDMPSFADKQFGKFMFQFKGFVMASVQRLVQPIAQGVAHGDVMAYNGIAAMLALGGLRYYLKEKAAGRDPDLSPRNFGSEMLQGSGLLAFLPDIYDPIAGMTHLPRFSKFKDHTWEETLGGPSMGELDTLGNVLSSVTSGQMRAQDLHKMRQLLPFQNLFYVNRLFNMAEGSASDALNLKNATGKPALDYLDPSKDAESQPRDPDKKHFLGINAIPN